MTVTGISLAGYFLPSEEPQSMRPPLIGELAQDLSSSSAERRSAAIALIAERLPLDHPDRNAGIAALVNHLSARLPDDGSTVAEASDTLTALGLAQVPSDQIDLRYSYLDGIDVSGLEFADGIPLYGASLKDATLVNVLIGSGNWQDMFMERSWLGNCRFRRVLFTGTDLSYVNAPGTEFRECQFSRAVLTGADFSTSVFIDCDFKGEDFVVESARGLPAVWDPDDPPQWPAGFLPNILT
ncbi:pentapeptide repeat-containing protein [Nocardiopsis sp. N85]|uniref:pentapeptide repeat-containing protein n=1 Tax=Nocardiopsis sp. N85 TaxID=3029400 RepID=UPI00237FC37B|nr:pentapeptide repeat-containing protein [Nocardiopsis sp. N85]MDE3721509.1 pentapeptide repeat-containing protein [Nocardiopsis sp. N85]